MRIAAYEPVAAATPHFFVVGVEILVHFAGVLVAYGASVRPENAATYSAVNEGRKICEDLSETAAFKNFAAKHERKSQLLIIPTYPRSAFSA